MTSLLATLDDYLRIRRRLRFAMPQDGRLLEGFVEFLQRAGAERITAELALEWARLPVAADPSRWGSDSGSHADSRGIWRQSTPRARSRPSHLLPGHRSRIAPYIYSEAEIAALMAAARALRPRLRAARHETLIGLLAVAAMRPGGQSGGGVERGDADRVGDQLGLDVQDLLAGVDLAQG